MWDFHLFLFFSHKGKMYIDFHNVDMTSKLYAIFFRQIYATQQKRHLKRMSHVQVATQVQKQQCVTINLHATENHWSITVSDSIRVLQKYAPPDITSQVAFKINDFHDNNLRKNASVLVPFGWFMFINQHNWFVKSFLSLYGFKRICRKISVLTFCIKSREK